MRSLPYISGGPILATLTLAACGSSSHTSRDMTPYGPKSSPYAMSKCFRENGVSNFPDPSAGPSGSVGFSGGVGSGSNGSMVVDGTTFAGPAFQKAQKACQAFLPSGPPPKPSESQRQKILAMAECMRAHGVPSFRDPTFGANGPTGPPPNVNPNSPAFRAAASKCSGRGQIVIGP